jgi:hypothetical protein
VQLSFISAINIGIVDSNVTLIAEYLEYHEKIGLFWKTVG